MLHAGTSAASHRRADAAWVDTGGHFNLGAALWLIVDLAQNRLQLLFAAYLAIRQAISFIALCRKLENCFWAPSTYSCSIVHMCCTIFYQMQNGQDEQRKQE